MMPARRRAPFAAALLAVASLVPAARGDDGPTPAPARVPAHVADGPYAYVQDGVEKLRAAAAEGEARGDAPSPALEATDDDKKTAQLLSIYASAATRFEWALEAGRRDGRAAERKVHFPSAVRRGVPSDLVHGVYFEPRREGDGRVPAAVVLHHTGGSFEGEAILARHLARHGVAALTIELPNYGSRKTPGSRRGFLDADDVEQVHEGFRQAVIDARRAADFLRSRPEVDPDRVGVVGISLGAIVGATAAGVDPRFARAVLVVGGGDLAKILENAPEAARVRERLKGKGVTPELLARGLASVDPVTFARRLRADDVLMLNAKSDEIIPRESTVALWRRAGYPEIRWYDGGHAAGIVANLGSLLAETLEHMAGRAAARESY